MINIVIAHSQASDELLQVIYIVIHTHTHTQICVQKVNEILVYLKSDIISTDKGDRFKQYESSLIYF
jgi:hypothetical protein